ncbi:hypothetical protein AbraIFM66951_003764 [Aspergillus brasiliensis]|nr:hypothetical protein AbraIFM66951_003764 [Aspergillus brasiliensis]
MFNRSKASPKGGVWTKVVIFISLYLMLLDSFIEWAIVLYLYAIRRVDSKMTPSLILALVASFFTVPLVALHSLLAWQYNRVVGFASQKALLNAACTYICRLTILVWIAASAAGLVVVSQQVYCLADDGGSDFWKIGISCALQRASVIVSIVSFVTVCLFFCSRELCERPYDISLVGVYKQQSSTCDDKMSSSSTLGSHISLENDIYHVCRRPDVTFGRDLYLSSSSNSICKSGSIEHPTSPHEKPQLKLDTQCEAESTGIYSGTTLSVDGTPSRSSSKDGTSSDVSSNASSTPPRATLKVPYEPYHPTVLAELPGSPHIKQGHKRHQPSGSSFLRLLPKVQAPPISLSSDPDILALAGPEAGSDFEQPAEKQSVEEIELPPTPKREYAPGHPLASSPVELPFPSSPPVERSLSSLAHSNPELTSSRSEGSTLPRSISSSSADAPEVVVPEPLRVYRSRTHHTAPITSQFNFSRPKPPVLPIPARQLSHSYQGSLSQHGRSRRQNTVRSNGRRSQVYRFEACQIPRHTQSQYHPQQARYARRSYFDTHRRMPSRRRRNDVEIVYSSTRRPRSNTCGGFGTTSSLDCIRETGASVDEPGDIFADGNTYRGTTRTTSAHGMYTY